MGVMTPLVVYVIWVLLIWKIISLLIVFLAIFFWVLMVVFLTKTDRDGIIGRNDSRLKEMAEYLKTYINKNG